MATNRLYNVKQAARLLGLSTNTLYKYLNEGRIQAARGQARGTFRIPAKSLETFLGSKLPEETAIAPPPADSLLPLNQQKRSRQAVTIQVTPPSLTVKVARALLLLVLILMIGDVFLAPNFSINSQFVRLIMIAVFILLSYQFGGFSKR